MKLRKVISPIAGALLVVLMTFLVIGCGSQGATTMQHPIRMPGASVPPWALIWHPDHPISQNVPVKTAFFEGARGVDAYGNEHPIYAAAWLMVGPTHGEAIVQFAKGDSYLNQAGLSVNPTTHDWEGGGGGIPTRYTCGKGTLTYSYLGPTCGIDIGREPDGVFRQWLAPDGQFFMASRLSYSATYPAGATSVLLGKTSGWMTQPGFGYTSLVVPLPAGHTFLLASTAGPARTLAAARAIMAHLDDFMPE